MKQILHDSAKVREWSISHAYNGGIQVEFNTFPAPVTLTHLLSAKMV